MLSSENMVPPLLSENMVPPSSLGLPENMTHYNMANENYQRKFKQYIHPVLTVPPSIDLLYHGYEATVESMVKRIIHLETLYVDSMPVFLAILDACKKLCRNINSIFDTIEVDRKLITVYEIEKKCLELGISMEDCHSKFHRNTPVKNHIKYLMATIDFDLEANYMYRAKSSLEHALEVFKHIHVLELDDPYIKLIRLSRVYVGGLIESCSPYFRELFGFGVFPPKYNSRMEYSILCDRERVDEAISDASLPMVEIACCRYTDYVKVRNQGLTNNELNDILNMRNPFFMRYDIEMTSKILDLLYLHLHYHKITREVAEKLSNIKVCDDEEELYGLSSVFRAMIKDNPNCITE